MNITKYESEKIPKIFKIKKFILKILETDKIKKE